MWTPTIGGSDVTLVIVDSGSGDALPTNYLGPLTVSGSSVSSSSSSSSSSSTTGSSSSSSSTASVLSSTSATMSTTVVPVNTTTLVRSSTRVYAMNSTTSATGKFSYHNLDCTILMIYQALAARLPSLVLARPPAMVLPRSPLKSTVQLASPHLWPLSSWHLLLSSPSTKLSSRLRCLLFTS